MKASAIHLMPGCRMEPLGDQAFTLTFGDAVDPGVNQLACTIASHIAEANFPFVADVVPSFCAVGVHYKVDRVLRLPGRPSGPPWCVRFRKSSPVRVRTNKAMLTSPS